MKLITQQILANEAAERYKQMHTGAPNCYGYGPDGWRKCRTYLHSDQSSYSDVHRQLVELGPTPNPDDVARIINPSWVESEWCVACGGRQPRTVLISEIDNNPIHVCESCVRKALSVFDQ